MDISIIRALNRGSPLRSLRPDLDAQPTLPLIDRLVLVAARWAAAHEATLARLGREVVNDGGFFGRLEAPGANTTTATLEKFARFLAEPGNWPGGTVPGEAHRFAHIMGISASSGDPATSESAQIAGEGEPRTVGEDEARAA